MRRLLQTTYLDAGMISYKKALELQLREKEKIIKLKERGQDTLTSNMLIFCEHPPVLTFGSSAKKTDLLIPRNQLSSLGLASYTIRRGGAITFHGPGQIVGYPILDLENFKRDVRWFIESIALVVIKTLDDYNIESYYDCNYPGVWIREKTGTSDRKICAIGVHLSKWVSSHGFAFNISNEMHYYKYFNPCGICVPGRTVTNLENELHTRVDIEEVKRKILIHFATIFKTDVL